MSIPINSRQLQMKGSANLLLNNEIMEISRGTDALIL